MFSQRSLFVSRLFVCTRQVRWLHWRQHTHTHAHWEMQNVPMLSIALCCQWHSHRAAEWRLGCLRAFWFVGLNHFLWFEAADKHVGVGMKSIECLGVACCYQNNCCFCSSCHLDIHDFVHVSFLSVIKILLLSCWRESSASLSSSCFSLTPVLAQDAVVVSARVCLLRISLSFILQTIFSFS